MSGAVRIQTLLHANFSLDEVRELFDRPAHFHLGADNAHLLDHCPDCRKRVDTDSKGVLYSEHLRPLVERCLEAGSRPMAWADVVLAHSDTLATLPRELMWVDWDYHTGDTPPDRMRLWGKGFVDLEEARALPEAFRSV